MERRLAAILFYDVVGYSKFMGRDEASTIDALKANRSMIIAPIAKQHCGRTIQVLGDGGFMEFASAVDAVRFAMAMQNAVAERNSELPKEQCLVYRIGINIGDVVADEDYIYGDGVNIAARLEGLALPGGICIASVVYEQIAGRIEQKFDDLGYRTLKNILKPVRIYAFRILDADKNNKAPSGWPYMTAAKEKQPVTAGGCLCGSVRYEIWGEPAGLGYCHCRFCQLALGAPLNAWVAYEENAISFAGDEAKIYKSSPIAERGFCGNCGTSLYTDIRGSDGLRYYSIRLATLDNPENFPPKLDFGVESKLPWLDINDDLPRICTEDDPELAKRWAAVGQLKRGPILGTAMERQHSDLKDQK